MATPKGQTFELRLPAGSRDRYLAAIEPIPPQMRVWWRYHEVAEGDSLASIARTYRTSVKAIGRATFATMISRSWFLAYFTFSHRPADGEERR